MLFLPILEPLEGDALHFATEAEINLDKPYHILAGVRVQPYALLQWVETQSREVRSEVIAEVPTLLWYIERDQPPFPVPLLWCGELC